MKNSEVKYGRYIEDLCCNDCDYAGEYHELDTGRMVRVEICPKCGGQLLKQVGRWVYTDPQPTFLERIIGYDPPTVYHKFIKGRECESLSTPPAELI